MEITTNPEAEMTLAERISYHYTALKMFDRATPGRTPWQTLKARAERIAMDEMLTEEDRVA